MGGTTDRKIRTVEKDSGKEQIISLEDLYKLLEHTPRTFDTVEIECPLWYKIYMERKYGKVNNK